MYLWNVNGLIRDLQTNQVSEKETMKYYLLTAILRSLPKPYEHGFAFAFITPVLIITALGIVLCYEVNSRNDNNNFITRMICLSVPLSVRFLVFLVPLYIVLAFIFPSLTDENGIRKIILDSGVTMLFFLCLKSYIEKVSKGRTPDLETQDDDSTG